MDAEVGEAGAQQQQAEASTSSAAAPFDRSSSRLSVPGAESFDGALRELKDLRSQLNEAADCCEKAFINTEKKKLILESTKSYICDAVVAVIDHLGTVSSKLEHKIEERTEVTEMEQKLDFLKQAGAFARNAPAPAASGGEEVEEAGDVGSRGIGDDLHLGDATEISSENTGPGGGHSGGGSGEEGDGGDRKRRKSYHRHTTEQIRVMEAMFKESPHPDDQQRKQLSRQLGLTARQVKFWFQNRRTQIKAIQERQENSLLKSELEKLREENRAMRELVKKSSHCPSCGVPSSFSTSAATTEEQLLRLENARLKAEVETLRGTPGKAADDAAGSPSLTSPSCAIQQINTSPSSLDDCVDSGFLLSHDKARILELASAALDELKTMCSAGEPLWVRSVETGRDVLNYSEYLRLFPRDEDSGDGRPGWSIEASRETGIVYLDSTRLVQAFMDVNQWKELFPSMVSKASTLSVIQTGDNVDQDGVVQVMLAEVQMLTSVVPTRESRFLRYCKKLTAEKWATVDVSFDKIEPDAQTSSRVWQCLRKPSGCIMEEQTNAHCKVTWVEHTTCRDVAVPSMYRAATVSSLAFGARRWVAALQLQCERMVFSVATNIPTRDSNGVSTPAGRRSVLKLAHRMTSSLCRGIGASRGTAWSKALNAGGGDVRVMSRKNTGDPGEPQGLIACAVLSTWLPVSPTALLGFLRDETRRHEWDVMLPVPGRSVQSHVNVTKGKDRANCVTIYAAAEDKHAGKWILQDSCTGPCESVLTYAAVDAAILRPVIDGHDSSNVALLPCGFAVTPDGLDSRSAVITSSNREDANRAAGSLVTMAFQALVSTAGASSATTGDALPPDSVATVTGLAACTLGNIRKALRCEDC